MSALPSPLTPFVGRTDVLESLTGRAVAGDLPSITLVGGDAGVGKTRLLTEVVSRARGAGSRVLLGHCLDLGESSAPYLPVAQMLRHLDGQETADLRRQWPQLGPLLPAGPTVPAAGEDLGGDQGPGPLLEAVHAFLEHLAEAGRLLVVVEDAHWADRSTRLLLTYLFTMEFRGPVSLIVSYRSDDLFRKHPLRHKLAEWTRLPHVQRISLDPLTDADVSSLLRSLSPGLPDKQVGRIIERSAGNPFFAEELLNVVGSDCEGLPDELADLLLVRVEALDDVARTVVRAASVAGQFIPDALLRAVVDLDDSQVEQALRSAIEHHIIRITSSGGYAFRHALLAEAVADDLLPGERVRLHRRYAEAWQTTSKPGAAAGLALHARAAGMLDRALEASIAAGDEAMASSGPADAAQHYENALALLAETAPHTPPLDAGRLALRAGSALLVAGDPRRAAEVFHAAYADERVDPGLRAKLAARTVEAELAADTPQLDTGAVDDAIAGLDQEPASPTLATLHAVRARAFLSERDFDAAALAAGEALRLARELDLPRIVTDATTTLARLDDYAGDPEASRRGLWAVIEKARDSGDAAAEVRALHQLAFVRARANKPGEAAELMTEAADRAVELNFTTGPFALDARAMAAYYSVLVGEWDRAERLLDRARALRIPELPASLMRAVRATLLHHRGRVDDALAEAAALRPLWGRDMFTAIHSGTICVLVHGERGDLPAMLDAYDGLVSALLSGFQLKAFDAQIRFGAELIGFLATAVQTRRARTDEYADRVLTLVDDVERVVDLRDSSAKLGLESQAWLCLSRAERARFEWHGAGALPTEVVTRTTDAVQLFDRLGHRYDAAVTRARLAELLATSGRLDEARDVASVALREARALGARSLVAGLSTVVRGSGPAPRPSGLTPREHDVLALLVEGCTNGEIAGRLFITSKTASVHVSNILGKLGASTRTEAATIATREGLV